ncbi:MAG: NCS2 family permease [Prevotellaceae bacterium]|jgi:AGZA family xanthine/uracil permease-like MFS transporter|nr:NCS2 family permease [Prevotellaceae bacterium]
MKEFVERYFHVKASGSSIRREVLAGFVTFLTMSYILVVNPSILSATGMDKEALFTATALVSIFATLAMALYAKLPIAQAPGMGLNAFFAFTICGSMGYSWQFALTAVFLEGIIFILLTFLNVRELIVHSIPQVIKEAIPIGIGLFITLIGLKNAGIVVPNADTLVAVGDMGQHSVWIALLGLLVMGVLQVRRVKGSILIGIAVATLFGVVLGDVDLPHGSLVSTPPSIAPIALQFEWNKIVSLDMLVIVFTLLFVNLFDTVGTLIGVATQAGLMDKDGHILGLKRALMCDALGTTAASMLGTSTVTAYVESASGVAAGGRTGLTALSTALWFVLALFLAPLFLMVPAAATSPALILVGLFMMTPISQIDFANLRNGLPAFLTIVFMPFMYSIAEGIVFGLLSYTFIYVLSGKARQVTPTVYVISLLFLLKIVVDVVW